MDLLPCPFCGGEAEIERYGTARVSTIYQCADCGASLETGEVRNHGKLWNTRAPSEAVLVEALEEARELVESWGAYAPQYFQEKHDLAGDLVRLDAALAAAKGERV